MNEPTMDWGLGIPVSRRATCCFCAILVDSAAYGTFELVHGWVENRKSGGAHYPALMVRHKRFACKQCIDRQRDGISPNQGTLFDVDLGLDE